MLLSEQLGEQLVEREQNQFDKEWTTGIRRWWNSVVGAAHTYPGRIETTTFLDGDAVMAGGAAALRAIDQVRDALTKLRDDLLINKGFWQPKGTQISKDDRKFGGTPKVWREKIVTELEAAEEAVSDARGRITHWANVADPKTPAHFGRDAYPNLFQNEKEWNGIPRSIALAVDEGADKANEAIDRLLRYLSKIAGQSVDPVQLGDTVPDVVDVAGAKLIFDPLPSPARAARVDMSQWTPLVNRKSYVEQLLKAKALLTKRGLGFLWYGHFYVRPEGTAPENHLGKNLGVAANYHSRDDAVNIFQLRNLYVTIAHELGHRLWFKHLTQAQRLGFAEFFGKVPSPTDYGALNTEEDFAEVFEAYIDGKNLTADQVERFKAFTKGKWKMESVSDELDEARGERCT